jgi:hypothetical protein
MEAITVKIQLTDSNPIRSWVVDHLDFIRNQAETSPMGHEGDVLAIKNLQLQHTKDALHPLGFPYEQLQNINDELMDYYQIPKNCGDAKLGWMLVYAREGYKCRVHRDASGAQQGFYSTRLNVLISKSEVGGDPVMFIDGKEVVIDVEENEPWLCVSGRYEHSTTRTKGPTPRILLSFGYDLDAQLIEQLDYVRNMNTMLAV